MVRSKFVASASWMTWNCDFSTPSFSCLGLIPATAERARTTMDIERRSASLLMGLPYRYATTRILGLSSILRELRSSLFTKEFSIPSLQSGKRKFLQCRLPCRHQIPEEDLNRFFQVDFFSNNRLLLFLCFEIIFEGVVVFQQCQRQPSNFPGQGQLRLPMGGALCPNSVVVGP